MGRGTWILQLSFRCHSWTVLVKLFSHSTHPVFALFLSVRWCLIFATQRVVMDTLHTQFSLLSGSTILSCTIRSLMVYEFNLHQNNNYKIPVWRERSVHNTFPASQSKRDVIFTARGNIHFSIAIKNQLGY